MRKPKKLNIVYLDLLDWGASAGGEHYYAKIKFEDKNGKYQSIELVNTLTQKMATYLNKKERCKDYQKGDESLRFDSPKDAVKVAIKTCKELDHRFDLILRGHTGGITEALWGDNEKVKRINELYEEAESIGWYSHPRFPNKEKDDRMEAIDDEFNKIIGEK